MSYLRSMAMLWGQEYSDTDARADLQSLVAVLKEPVLVMEIVGDLDESSRTALDDLLHHAGRIPWAQFARRHGDVREMGAAARDREQPYLRPASPAEVLWYRALVSRAFFDTPNGLEEFAYIPDDLLDLIPSQDRSNVRLLGRQVLQSDITTLIPATDRILDNTCTLLAALRINLPPESVGDHYIAVGIKEYLLIPSILQSLLLSAGLLGSGGFPRPESTRAFLESSRGEALAGLARAWMESADFNELRLLSGINCEGEWVNDPQHARRSVLDLLLRTISKDSFQMTDGGVSRRPFTSLAAFVEDVRLDSPDFQRKAGDYDSWFIRDIQSGGFLRGFESWDRIDGELIRFLVCGPLHWLGIMDLALSRVEGIQSQGSPSAFRFSLWADSLLGGVVPTGLPTEEAMIQITSDGGLHIPLKAPRVIRYQVARFCEWLPMEGEIYAYRITANSLERARQAGLRAGHLLAILHRFSLIVPPSLVRALEQWEKFGSQARLDRLVVLRVRNPEILQSLRNSRAGRFLGEPLGPTAVVVRAGAVERVLAALTELGYFGDVDFGEGISNP